VEFGCAVCAGLYVIVAVVCVCVCVCVCVSVCVRVRTVNFDLFIFGVVVHLDPV